MMALEGIIFANVLLADPTHTETQIHTHSSSVAKLKFGNGTELWLKKYFFTSNGTFVEKKNTPIHI